MGIAAAVGETLVSLEKLDHIAKDAGSDVIKYLKEEEPDPNFQVAIDDNQKLSHQDFAQARRVQSPKNDYQGIGLGKPLTIVLETIYVGDYPDAMRWIPGDQEGDILVTTSYRAFEIVAAASRSVHMLQPEVKRRKYLEVKPYQEGTKLVYYTPAVTDISLYFSVELSSDRELDASFGESFSKALKAATGLPIFAPAAPYLLAAGAAIPIGQKAADLLARPRTFYEQQVEFAFDRPGVELVQPGALVLSPDAGGSHLAAEYHLGEENKLYDAAGREYRGELSYVVVSLDGTKHDRLEGWSAVAASAVILERFFKPDELFSQSLNIVKDSVSLYNDMKYRNLAVKERKAADAAQGANKDKHETLYQAYLANIQNEDLRTTVGAAG